MLQCVAITKYPGILSGHMSTSDKYTKFCVRTRVYMFERNREITRVYTFACVFVCVCMRVRPPQIGICRGFEGCTYIYLYIYIYVCLYIYIYIYITYMYICIARIHTHTYMHAYMQVVEYMEKIRGEEREGGDSSSV